jgi:hypothetical protein
MNDKTRHQQLLALRIFLRARPACPAPANLLRAAALLAGALIFFVPFALESYASEEPMPIAIADFDYTDTSGEPSDQRAAHAARLSALMSLMRAGLAGSGKFRIVPLVCEPGPCSFKQTPPAGILEAARRAGARLLVFGGIHKMSTLVQWAKLQAVDLQTDKPVLDRLLTFRGDTDEAWRRAGDFMVGQVKALALTN